MNTELITASARLSRAAPQEWDEFLKVFQGYADYWRDQCVKSPLDELARNQGRAQQTVAVYELFKDAVKSADRIAERRK